MTGPRIDPSTPAWMLDVAGEVKMFQNQRLLTAMDERGENITDMTLWRHRLLQLHSLLCHGHLAEGGQPS